MLVIAEKPGGSIAVDLPGAIACFGCRAQFHKQSRGNGVEHARTWLEVNWRRPEVAGPPLDLLNFLNEHYWIVSFEVIPGSRL
jgi:putative Mg2+ transporter-C (MgtC) family protein